MAVHVERSGQRPTRAWARYLSMLIAAWLVLSAFLWPHTVAEQTDAWAAGAVAFFFSLSALFSPTARYLNALLAIWLFVTTVIAPRTSLATLLNDCIAAALLFALSLVPGARIDGHEPDEPAHA